MGIYQQGSAADAISKRCGLRIIASNRTTKTISAEAHFYHLTRESDLNTTVPQFLHGGVVFFQPGLPGMNPALGASRIVTPDANSSYNALQAELTKRLGNGLRFKFSYTYSKAIDDFSSFSSTNVISEPSASLNPFDRNSDRSLSPFDVRHGAVTNFSYNLPGNNLSGKAGPLIHGWQLSGILTLTSGHPADVLTGFNQSGSKSSVVADRPDLVAGKSNNPVLGGPDKYFAPTAFVLQPAGFFGNWGRNTLIGPGLAGLDAILTKSTSLTERLKMDFRFEIFNLLNHANFGLPNISLYTSTGAPNPSAGRISATVSSSRQIQFGLKFLF